MVNGTWSKANSEYLKMTRQKPLELLKAICPKLVPFSKVLRAVDAWWVLVFCNGLAWFERFIEEPDVHVCLGGNGMIDGY